ncbi:MAG: exopolysaccharide biosynthesis protein [Spirulinaceae cyanobacterium]
MYLNFSQDIEYLLEALTHQPLTIKDVLQETSQRGITLVIALLVLPFLVPMPPGSASILGLGCFLLAIQMALGKNNLWLPKRVSNYQFPQKITIKLLQKLKSITQFLEKFVRPRLLGLAKNPYIWRLNGVCIAWLTILLILPLPFTNFMPTIGILFLAIAMLEADGLLMCVSYFLSFLITLIFAFLGYSILQTSSLLLN